MFGWSEPVASICKACQWPDRKCCGRELCAVSADGDRPAAPLLESSAMTVHICGTRPCILELLFQLEEIKHLEEPTHIYSLFAELSSNVALVASECQRSMTPPPPPPPSFPLSGLVSWCLTVCWCHGGHRVD